MNVKTEGQNNAEGTLEWVIERLWHELVHAEELGARRGAMRSLQEASRGPFGHIVPSIGGFHGEA